MLSIKSEILHKVAEYDDAAKLKFYSELLNWINNQANIVHNRMLTPNIEIVKDDDQPMEIITT